MHCHPGSFWSGCFYVDDGGIGGREGMGGAIEFYDPRGPLPMAYNPLLKMAIKGCVSAGLGSRERSEEHTSELQSLMRISYAVFCLKKKTHNTSMSHAATQTSHNTNKYNPNSTRRIITTQYIQH